MKRCVSFVLFCLLVGGLVFLLTNQLRERADIAQLLPRETFFLFDMQRPVDAGRDFYESRLGKQLQNVEWENLLSALGVDDAGIKSVQDIINTQEEILSNPLLHELIDRRLVVAAFPAENDAAHSDFVLIARPRHSASVLDRIVPVFSDELEITNSSYQGFSLRRFVYEQNFEVYATVQEGFIFASLHQHTLHRCLDLLLENMTNKNGGLSANHEYQRQRGYAKNKDRLFLYLDAHKANRIFAEMVEKKALNIALDGSEENVKAPPGILSFSLFLKESGNKAAYHTRMHLEPAMLEGYAKQVFAKKPKPNQKIKKMPPGLLFYFWTNWFDLSTWWRVSSAQFTGREREFADRFTQWVERRTDMEFDALLSLFGNEAGINMSEILTSGFFPVPRLCFCFSIKDKQKISEIIEKNIEGLPLSRKRKGDVEVISLMAAGGLMQPAYALTDRYLLVADNGSQIEVILEPGVKTLVQEADYKAMDLDLAGANNMVAFARAAELVEGLKELVSWAGTVVAIRDPNAGRKSKILVDQVIFPIMDGLKMYRLIGSRSYLEHNDLVMKTVVVREEANDE